MMEVSGANRTRIVDDNGILGGPLNWSGDGKTYHYSIYIGTSNFTVDAFDTNTNIRRGVARISN